MVASSVEARVLEGAIEAAETGLHIRCRSVSCRLRLCTAILTGD